MRRKATKQERYTFQRVVGGASQIFGLAPDVIVGRSRQKRHAEARSFVIYVCRAMGHSTTTLGDLLDRDHTTIIKVAERFDNAFCSGHAWAARAMGLWLAGKASPTDEEARDAGSADASKAISLTQENEFLRLRVSELENAIAQASGVLR